MPYDPAGRKTIQQSNSDVRLQSSDKNETNINVTKEQELPSLTKEWKMAMDMKYIIDQGCHYLLFLLFLLISRKFYFSTYK